MPYEHEANDRPSTLAPGTVVLKFGSSVLRSPSDARRVVLAIYDHVRRGQRVVAVASAFRGRTDELIALASQNRIEPNSAAGAALVSLGEAEASALLAGVLQTFGIQSSLLSPADLGIIASGPYNDASIRRVVTARLERELDRGRVVVVPGFTGINASGETVLLGRGGSDNSAVAVGHALDAEIRLINDTGGVFAWDPAEPGPSPARFATLRWDDALALGDRAVQAKALQHAAGLGQSITIAGLDRSTETTIGPVRSELAEHAETFRPPTRVALLGLGTVGSGVASLLAGYPERFHLIGALVRDPNRPRQGAPDDLPLFTDPQDLWHRAPDLIIEAIGGTERASEIVRESLHRGLDVITANKALIAEHGPELAELAAQTSSSLRYSAAVGGALPAIELARKAAQRFEIAEIRGVLNGTTNSVLNAWRDGHTLGSAIAQAQLDGFAEADPTLDLSGFDAACKLAILASEGLGVRIDPHTISLDPLDDIRLASFDRTSPLRQIARVRVVEGRPEAGVDIEPVFDGPLADLPGATNAIEILGTEGQRITLRAAGAGRWPTALAVLADVFDREHDLDRRSQRLGAQPPATPPLSR